MKSTVGDRACPCMYNYQILIVPLSNSRLEYWLTASTLLTDWYFISNFSTEKSLAKQDNHFSCWTDFSVVLIIDIYLQLLHTFSYCLILFMDKSREILTHVLNYWQNTDVYLYLYIYYKKSRQWYKCKLLGLSVYSAAVDSRCPSPLIGCRRLAAVLLHTSAAAEHIVCKQT